jgi:hypothetical protein
MTAKYRTQLASDIVRDGLSLELVDERGSVLAEVFRCDADHTIVLELFAASIPPPNIDQLVADAYQRLAPFEDGMPLPPPELLSRLYRDASGRLTFSLDVVADRYSELRARVVGSFRLSPASAPATGLDVEFQDFDSDHGLISLHWDNWMGFTVSAGSTRAEELVRRIAKKLAGRSTD